MSIDLYFDKIKQWLKDFSPFISSKTITFEARSTTLGKIKGQVIFTNASKLYLLEIVDSAQHNKIQYSYHYQTRTGKIIFRYDNAPHYKKIKTFPHHKHLTVEQNILATNEPTLHLILKEIISFLF